MRVTLIDYTGAGSPDPARHAANILVFTKMTRLKMTPGRLGFVESMPWEKIEAELAAMARTIPSSWEFVHYTFLIEDVTRAFTHQFVRTRTASYAQQTMRTLDMKGWRYAAGPSLPEGTPQRERYDQVMSDIADGYDDLRRLGVPEEDARGVLPTNVLTNIVMGCSLRTLVELSRKRASLRTQGEYRAVLEAMKAAAIRAHPWMALFLERGRDVAAAELDEGLAAAALPDGERNRLLKLVSELRQD